MRKVWSLELLVLLAFERSAKVFDRAPIRRGRTSHQRLAAGLLKRMCPLPNVSTDQPCAVATLASWRISLLARLVSPGCFFLIPMDPPSSVDRSDSMAAGGPSNLTAEFPGSVRRKASGLFQPVLEIPGQRASVSHLR